MSLRDRLEQYQIAIYFSAVLIGLIFALVMPSLSLLQGAINPFLGLMLFATFLQVPINELAKAIKSLRFLSALLLTNFIILPIFVALLLSLFPQSSLITLGVLMVLLTPCIDYVVTFSHLGKADSKRLLASTPILLLCQMVLLPIYLSLFLGVEARTMINITPFIEAFIGLIVIPLCLAGLVQWMAMRSLKGQHVFNSLSLLPVPATALVLFTIIAALFSQLGNSLSDVLSVLPIYILFGLLAPIIGWWIGRLFKLNVPARRAISFSAGTRNSLVILPLALSIDTELPILPAIIVTQTLVELIFELIYIQIISRWGRNTSN